MIDCLGDDKIVGAIGWVAVFGVGSSIGGPHIEWGIGWIHCNSEEGDWSWVEDQVESEWASLLEGEIGQEIVMIGCNV